MLDSIQCLFVNVVVVIFAIVSVVVIVNTFKFLSPELLNQLPFFQSQFTAMYAHILL